jgi:hypothetical protein
VYKNTLYHGELRTELKKAATERKEQYLTDGIDRTKQISPEFREMLEETLMFSSQNLAYVRSFSDFFVLLLGILGSKLERKFTAGTPASDSIPQDRIYEDLECLGFLFVFSISTLLSILHDFVLFAMFS